MAKANEQESVRQCRFCLHFEQEFDAELVNFSCVKNHFLPTDDQKGYPPQLALTCPDFVLNDSLGSRWSKLPQEYKDSLTDG
jgi:hypothetical protein